METWVWSIVFLFAWNPAETADLHKVSLYLPLKLCAMSIPTLQESRKSCCRNLIDGWESINQSIIEGMCEDLYFSESHCLGGVMPVERNTTMFVLFFSKTFAANKHVFILLAAPFWTAVNSAKDIMSAWKHRLSSCAKYPLRHSLTCPGGATLQADVTRTHVYRQLKARRVQTLIRSKSQVGLEWIGFAASRANFGICGWEKHQVCRKDILQCLFSLLPRLHPVVLTDWLLALRKSQTLCLKKGFFFSSLFFPFFHLSFW